MTVLTRLGLLFLALGLACAVAYRMIGSHLDQNGTLVEPFFLIPLGWLGVVIGLALFLAAVWHYMQLGKFRAALIVAAATILLLLLMLMDVDVEWLRNISRSSTVEIRLWGWQATLEQTREHWLLGYGARSDLQLPLDDPRYIEIGEPFWHPHNVFLSVWYQAGLIGLALLVALVVALARKLRPLQGDRQTSYWSTIFIFVLLICLVDSPALVDRPATPWIWFWLPLAIALSADKIPADSRSDPQTNTP